MTAPSLDYQNPPVIEVVCGVSFTPLERFQAIHVGMFWEHLKADFPGVEEHPPIGTVIERFPGPTPPTAEIQYVETPPLPRVWFLDKSGNEIIQVQRDVFLLNWRKLAPTDEYPRFRIVMGNFRNHLERFRTFVEEQSLGSITPIQYELTYVNHVVEGPLWSQGKSVGELFPDFVWRKPSERFMPFLPNYEAANWRTTFRLPEESGRLHVSIQTAFRRTNINEPLVVFEMKARGIGMDRSLDALPSWFNIAHEWIVRGFADLTS